MCKRGEINRSCGRAVRLLFKASCAHGPELFRSGQTERVTRVTLIPEESTSVELKFLSWLIGEQSYLSNLVSKPEWAGGGTGGERERERTDRSPNLFRHTLCKPAIVSIVSTLPYRKFLITMGFRHDEFATSRVAFKSFFFFFFIPDELIFSRGSS